MFEHIITIVISLIFIVFFMGIGYLIGIKKPDTNTREDIVDAIVVCDNPLCGCALHEPDTFVDGGWESPFCQNSSCDCTYHVSHEFSEHGRWIPQRVR